MKNYYAVLQVGRDADEPAIRAAYRRLCRQYHPDANGGARTYEPLLREVQEAYETLGDATLKADYDRRWLLRQRVADAPGPQPPAPPPPPKTESSPVNRVLLWLAVWLLLHLLKNCGAQ